MAEFEPPSAMSFRTSGSRSARSPTRSRRRRRMTTWHDDLGIIAERRRQPAEPIGEFVDVGNAVLQRVADPKGPPRSSSFSGGIVSTYCDRRNTTSPGWVVLTNLHCNRQPSVVWVGVIRMSAIAMSG